MKKTELLIPVGNKECLIAAINNGADACPSFPIYEDEIKPILFEVFGETRVDVEALLETYYEMAMDIIASGGELPEELKAFIEKYYDSI